MLTKRRHSPVQHESGQELGERTAAAAGLRHRAHHRRQQDRPAGQRDRAAGRSGGVRAERGRPPLSHLRQGQRRRRGAVLRAGHHDDRHGRRKAGAPAGRADGQSAAPLELATLRLRRSDGRGCDGRRRRRRHREHAVGGGAGAGSVEMLWWRRRRQELERSGRTPNGNAFGAGSEQRVCLWSILRVWFACDLFNIIIYAIQYFLYVHNRSWRYTYPKSTRRGADGICCVVLR